jgi:hypothetical protein
MNKNKENNRLIEMNKNKDNEWNKKNMILKNRKRKRNNIGET